ncbi:hypothetical protein SAY87_013194 [Trapa incisa]|uniref:Homeobox domain-containing protein n=1 Tax=Trapa incisa TaxID=236973 RepID=A0AAN7QCJ8_9MYRT|nr:hypothetical protein SAY87_013194 [Trapa incisa]
MSRAGSPRWCPTPEQVMILKELYRAGVRSPRASQIHKITEHLALYGKIEGRNVFYWFQNHKARDKQKLLMKKKFIKQHHHHQQQQQLCQRQISPNSCFCQGCLNHHQSPADTASPGFPHHGYYNGLHLSPIRSLNNLLQEANTNKGSSRPMMDSNCQRVCIIGDDPQKAKMEKSSMKMYNGIWTTAMNIAASSEPRPAEPLKTLQLFPTQTSTDLRETAPDS